mmetsp:Transcript_5142/g.14143  ORF Transcript_5142/g.14143 Transcript_5142/m.14143 type:complete len:108 (+) Transcript_5142:1501-1824(+)
MHTPSIYRLIPWSHCVGPLSSLAAHDLHNHSISLKPSLNRVMVSEQICGNQSDGESSARSKDTPQPEAPSSLLHRPPTNCRQPPDTRHHSKQITQPLSHPIPTHLHH